MPAAIPTWSRSAARGVEAKAQPLAERARRPSRRRAPAARRRQAQAHLQAEARAGDAARPDGRAAGEIATLRTALATPDLYARDRRRSSASPTALAKKEARAGGGRGGMAGAGDAARGDRGGVAKPCRGRPSPPSPGGADRRDQGLDSPNSAFPYFGSIRLRPTRPVPRQTQASQGVPPTPLENFQASAWFIRPSRPAGGCRRAWLCL